MSKSLGKNLEYNKQEPTFLRRLRGEVTSSSEFNERNNVNKIPKSNRLKIDHDDDEDDPVILDESGENVEKKDFEKMKKNGDVLNENVVVDGDPDANAEFQERQRIMEIGEINYQKKKRKVGKLIKDDEDEIGLSKVGKGDHGKKIDSNKSSKGDESEVKEEKKKGSKGKKIKLSFDET